MRSNSLFAATLVFSNPHITDDRIDKKFRCVKLIAFAQVVSPLLRLNCLVAALLCLWPPIALAKEALLDVTGRWYPGAILQGRVPPGSSVEVLGRSPHITPDGVFVFGLGRDAKDEVSISVKTSSGNSQNFRFAVEPRDYAIQKIEGVKKEHVTPPESVLARIRQENSLVRKARKTNDLRTDFLEDFIWPLKGRITGVYGSQRYYNGVPRSPHYGIDIAGPVGAPVKAPASGIVTLVHEDMYYSGGTLILDHGHGVSSTFIHLSKILVNEGERIKRGQTIAKVGASGRATGPHLDWRMNWFDQRVDPELLVQGKRME